MLQIDDVLLHDGVERFLKMFAMIFLLEDVDNVNGLNDGDVLDSPTVVSR